MMNNTLEDDGSLGFLKIPADETNKHFNCPETTQQKLINLTFWVCDYIEGVKTKFGTDRVLVKIKMNKEDKDSEAKKFFHCFVKPYIENELKLKVKDNWQIFPVAVNRYDRHGRALDYVGYKFYRKQKLIRKSIKQNFCKKVSALNKLENISEADYKQQVTAWLGWAKHSNSKHLLKTIIKTSYYGSIL